MVVTNACAPDPRVMRHAEWMHEAGYEVTVHAFDRDQSSPMSENHNGVRIMRYHLGITPYGGTLRTYQGIRRFQRHVVRTLLHDPPALVYCHDADTLRVGIDVEASCGTPFVFDMHDLQHTWVRFAAPSSSVRSFVAQRMKNRMLKRCQSAKVIITSSGKTPSSTHNGFADWLNHHGQQAVVVENRPSPPFGPEKTAPGDRWTVGFIGRVRDRQAIDALVAAVRSLPPHQRPLLRIAGDGVAAAGVRRMLMDLVEAGELEAEVSGAFTQQELPELISGIDVMFAMYAPQRGNIMQGALPVKMFDAASQGVPSVVNDGCLMGDVARDEGLGLTATWGDTAGIADALLNAKNTVVTLDQTGERERQRWLDAMRPVLEELQ